MTQLMLDSTLINGEMAGDAGCGNNHGNSGARHCPRCQGLLAGEFCLDLLDGTGENGFWALKCLQCGEVVDPVILRNRHAKTPTLLKDSSRRKGPVAAAGNINPR